MAFIQFLKPKNRLEEGGRNHAPMQLDEGEPEKNCPNCHKDIPISRLAAADMVCPMRIPFQTAGKTADRNAYGPRKLSGTV